MELDLILEADLTPDEITELGLLAEGYGFRAIWAQNYARARDAFLSLVPLALASKKIRLGVVVVSPYEMHPLKIANAILTLNEYTRGRTCIVIGAGGEWNGVMGVGYGKRVSTAHEAQEMIKQAFTGETLNYEGKIFKGYAYNAAWHDAPLPQLYAGASGEKLLRTAAILADGVMMSDVQVPMIANHMPHLTAALEANGRAGEDYRINNFVAWHVKEDAEVSYAEARRELIIRGWLERPWLDPFLEPEQADLVEQHKHAFLMAYRQRHGNIEGVPADILQALVDGLSCAGDYSSIDRHIEKLNQFGEQGFTEIALRLHDNPADSIRLLGERVLPALA
ncbi:MAG: LLM class flavin-dependent oxidoreductase [Gammaproteobacteria bacterium]|nr:LLM class flavin-dependent oxidoreductase [Gammaproteobacteria bacterium]